MAAPLNESRLDTVGERTRVVVLARDATFEELVRSTFGGNALIDLSVLQGGVAAAATDPSLIEATVVIADLDATRESDITGLRELAALYGATPPVVVVTNGFNEALARLMVQIRVADFLVGPVDPIDLVRACGRVARAPQEKRAADAEIFTFLPGAGGVGLTTIAVETSLQLLRSAPRDGSSTCLVDLDFQHGSCADYLDLEPRLDLTEIEHRPERLDRHLLEVMLSRHASGLAVIAAPARPAEMRSFDPDMVTRLLDLVSAHFDHVVIDMPRTWFSWTDSVLLGSNRLYIVTEMTIPGLRHAKQMLTAIRERLDGGPDPQVVVNRFEQRLFEGGLRKSDIEQTLGAAFAGVIPNNYRLVREAIDRGVPLEEVKPGNNVTAALKKIVLADGRAAAAPAAKDRSFFWSR